MIKAIVGANWGDEGKGKITDVLAGDSDIVVRFQGGSNAGHTIINEYGKFSLHQLPSGIFQPGTVNVISNGVALNVKYLIDEIKSINDAGIFFNLKVSNRAGILTPYHVLLDELEEERLKDKKFGSTKSGIAPFYSDKYAKLGFQVWELYEEQYLRDKIDLVCDKLDIIMIHLYNREKLNRNELYDTLRGYGELIKDYVCDTAVYLRNADKENKTILLEGQLGALRDIDHGIYPYVTSSPTTAGYAAVGAGVPPYEIKDIIAVSKAYSTAVGEGPFVTEIFGDKAQELRERGGDAGEYGATTGRPRRVGYFDCVATRYGCKTQGATQVVLTGLDVLGYMEEIPVCVGYELNGKVYEDFLTTSDLYKVKPVYTNLPGWKSDVCGIKNFEDLPEKAKDYILFIEKQIDTKITIISNGPKREEMFYRK